MSALVTFLLGILVLVVETFIRSAFGLDLWAPQCSLIFVLWLAVAPLTVSDLFIVAVLGLMADGLSASPAGTHALTGLALVLLLPQLTSRLQLSRGLGAAAFGAVGALLALLIVSVVARQMGSAGVAARMGELFIPQLVTVAIGAPLLFPVFDRIVRSRQRSAEAEAL